MIDGQAVTRGEQMPRTDTTGAVCASWHEHRRGSIEAGKLADLTVPDRGIMACPYQEVADIQVLAMYVSGELVFER